MVLLRLESILNSIKVQTRDDGVVTERDEYEPTRSATRYGSTRTITIYTVGLASQCTMLIESGMDVSRTRTLCEYMNHDEQLAIRVRWLLCVSFLTQDWSM